jgi:hypothetical protein
MIQYKDACQLLIKCSLGVNALINSIFQFPLLFLKRLLASYLTLFRLSPFVSLHPVTTAFIMFLFI